MIVESKKLNAYLLEELQQEFGSEFGIDMVTIDLQKHLLNKKYSITFFIKIQKETLCYTYGFNDGYTYDSISNHDDDVIISIFNRTTSGCTDLYNDIYSIFFNK